MIYGLKIKRNNSAENELSLEEILSTIKGKNLFWAILHLEGETNPKGTLSNFDLENLSSSEREGFQLSWDDLKDISKNFNQIMNGLFVGGENPESFKNYKNEKDLCLSCSYVISMFDSSFWILVSKDLGEIKKWAKTFKDSEIIVEDEIFPLTA